MESFSFFGPLMLLLMLVWILEISKIHKIEPLLMIGVFLLFILTNHWLFVVNYSTFYTEGMRSLWFTVFFFELFNCSTCNSQKKYYGATLFAVAFLLSFMLVFKKFGIAEVPLAITAIGLSELIIPKKPKREVISYFFYSFTAFLFLSVIWKLGVPKQAWRTSLSELKIFTLFSLTGMKLFFIILGYIVFAYICQVFLLTIIFFYCMYNSVNKFRIVCFIMPLIGIFILCWIYYSTRTADGCAGEYESTFRYIYPSLLILLFLPLIFMGYHNEETVGGLS